MSQFPSPQDPRPANPLKLPLLIVSAVALAEAAGMIFLAVALARRPEPAAWSRQSQHVPGSNGDRNSEKPAGASVSAAQLPAGTQSARGAQPPAGKAGGAPVGPEQDVAGTRGFALGKKGQRVESAGFAITVEQVNHEPMYKTLADWSDDYRYVAVLVVVENQTGGNADLLPANFRLQDDQGYPLTQLGVKLSEPKLPITTLGNGEKVRGYVDFVVPKTARGLKLVYSAIPTRNSQPIHVELGE